MITLYTLEDIGGKPLGEFEPTENGELADTVARAYRARVIATKYAPVSTSPVSESDYTDAEAWAWL